MIQLIEMSSDADADVRLAVVDAMQRFSDGRVVAPLAKALDDEDERVARQANSLIMNQLPPAGVHLTSDPSCSMFL